jgi:hypothetical protein
LVYRKRSLTFGIVTRYKLVIRTLHFGNWSSTDAKFGCSIKIDKLTTKSQQESGVSENSVRESKL